MSDTDQTSRKNYTSRAAKPKRNAHVVSYIANMLSYNFSCYSGRLNWWNSEAGQLVSLVAALIRAKSHSKETCNFDTGITPVLQDELQADVSKCGMKTRLLAEAP